MRPINKLSPRGQRDDMSPADGSSTGGGSTSIRGRVRSPNISGGRPAAGSQRADRLGSCATHLGWDRQTDRSRYRLMPPPLTVTCTSTIIDTSEITRNCRQAGRRMPSPACPYARANVRTHRRTDKSETLCRHLPWTVKCIRVEFIIYSHKNKNMQGAEVVF